MKPALAKSCPSCGERYAADVLFCPRDGTPLASSRRTAAFSSSERDPYIGIELGGQIQIRHLIGIGSMGRVYRAFQGGIERDVAVKILHRELSGNAELVSRFHREAKVASRLVHPNVVQVLMTGTVTPGDDPRIGGEMYLVMEHLDGISLLSALAAAGTSGESEALPLPRALHIALQISDAVGEAHAHGIVHRDLKPENVMLVRRREDPDYVKVLDFGIARLDWADKSIATQTGLIFGTAKYISPEGAEGHPVGPPADVYSIATILYQCLAGRAPFEGDSPVALLVQHTHAPPTDLRSIARASYVPSPIAQIVMQNLSKKPSDRASDARAFGRDLALAMRESGLDPDELAAPPGLLRASAMVKLASKSRTKALELSPHLAAQIGGIAAPTLESARPPSASDIVPIPDAARAAAPTDLQPGSGEHRASGGATLAWSSPPTSTTHDRPSHGLHPSSPMRIDPDDETPPPARSSRGGRAGSAPRSGRGAAPVTDLDFGAPHARDSASAPSTMQGVESEAHPRPRRARVARLVAIMACAAVVGFVAVLGGRHLGGFAALSQGDSLDDLIERTRDCMSRHAWDAPPGENVKEITAHALARWPSDARVAELRREAAERIITDALGRKYAGDWTGAIRLAKLALELHPTLTTAQHLAAELAALAPAGSEGKAPPAIAPAPTEPGTPDRQLAPRRPGLDAKPAAPPQPQPSTAPVGAAIKPALAPDAAAARPKAAPTSDATMGPAARPPASADPSTDANAAPAPELPPTPPPLPPEHTAPLPSSSGPWL